MRPCLWERKRGSTLDKGFAPSEETKPPRHEDGSCPVSHFPALVVNLQDII